MSDSSDKSSQIQLASQTIERLRRIIEGNGIEPDFITIIDQLEAVYSLTGKMLLAPGCDVEPTHYYGPVKGKQKTILQSIAAIREQALTEQKSFSENENWIQEAVEELSAAPAHGWGLDGAKITIPSHTKILAATETCPACKGQRLIMCQNCRGQKQVPCQQCLGHSQVRGQEKCYNCFGTGNDPTNSQRPCPICNGNRFILCRFCQGRGWVPCPSCGGRGGTTCTTCNGTGQITEELAITGYAQTNFHINKEQDFPSGLLRGMDRLGIVNLEKGHADITMKPPAGDKDDPKAKFTVQYTAKIPFADLKIRFGNSKAALVSVFGKRGLILGCPLFMDDAIKPIRTLLSKAAKGEMPVDDALTTRIAREALAIELSGRNSDKSNGVKELKKIYPVGLSPVAAREILRNISSAVGITTRKSRIIFSILFALISGATFAGVFLSPLHDKMVSGMSKEISAVIDIGLLAIALMLAKLGIWQSARFALTRKYPSEKIHIKQNVGKTGYWLFVSILALYAACIWIAPVKPWWFLSIAGT